MTISTLYSAPIVLWVEDELSRDYLSHLWQYDPLIKFCIAGGIENINAAVHDARVQGYQHVFGMRDRDFGETNRDRWVATQSDISVFVLDMHEIENYLLVPDALAGCELNTGSRSVGQISDKLLERARELSAWMACRKTISEIWGFIVHDFIRHPTCEEIPDLNAANQYISLSSWYSSIEEKMQEIAQPDHHAGILQRAHEEYEGYLQTDTWQSQFSGKELFHHVRDWLHINSHETGQHKDSDLAKSVAKWQVENNLIPQAMVDLLSAVRMRRGLHTLS